MRARLAIAVGTTVLTLLLGSGAQAHQTSTCITGLTTVGQGATALYVTQEGGGTWIYAESNNHAGLQTGGPTIFSTLAEMPNQDDTCFNHDCIPANECPKVVSDTGII